MRNAALLLTMACLAAGCLPPRQPEVVVYAALDREFSEPVLSDFTAQTGIRVLAKYDDESTKTVGLTNLLMQESSRPRCDVFWNNEVINTIRLAQRGLLDAYLPPAAAGFPEMYRAADGAWHGFAARARVLIVNTRLVADGERPTSIQDLAASRWKGQVGLARPIAGTTASHFACLVATWGEAETRRFLNRLKANDVKVLGGNKQVAQAAAAGQIAFGLTDTDDAIIELERAAPVAIVYPDREADQMGTLFLPNTLAIIRGAPHPAAARQLIDYLLTPAIEEQLARGPSAQVPLHAKAEPPDRVETPRTVKAMPVNFTAAAEHWDAAMRLIDEFLSGSTNNK